MYLSGNCGNKLPLTLLLQLCAIHFRHLHLYLCRVIISLFLKSEALYILICRIMNSAGKKAIISAMKIGLFTGFSLKYIAK